MLCFKRERFHGCFDTKEFHLYANLNQKENQSLFILPWVLDTFYNDQYYQFKDFPGVNIQLLRTLFYIMSRNLR